MKLDAIIKESGRDLFWAYSTCVVSVAIDISIVKIFTISPLNVVAAFYFFPTLVPGMVLFQMLLKDKPSHILHEILVCLISIVYMLSVYALIYFSTFISLG